MADHEKYTYLKRIVDNAQGDDFYRAHAAFRGKTPEQMKQQYGESGKTCQEILDGYRTEQLKWREAAGFLEELYHGRRA